MRGPTRLGLWVLLVVAFVAGAVWLVVDGDNDDDAVVVLRPSRVDDRIEPPPELPPDTTRVQWETVTVTGWRGDETIERRVVAEDGITPVAGVRVTLLYTPPRARGGPRPESVRLASTVTDASGTFLFEGVRRVDFQVRIEEPDHDPALWTVRGGPLPNRRGSSTLAPGDVQIGRDRRVTFVLVTETGAPVRGAVGEILDENLARIRTITCDERGRVTFVPDGKPSRGVLFRAPGRASKFVQGWRRGKDTLVILLRGHVVAGVVVDERGRPVNRARVTASTMTILGDQKVITGPDGTFRFDALTAHATYPVAVRTDDGRANTITVATGREDVRIKLPPAVSGGFVRGRVLRPDGSPAAGAIVDLSAECDAQGRFELRCSRDGDVTVGARFGYVKLPRAPHAWHAEFGTADMHLLPGHTVSGVTIQLAPSPVSFLRVQLTDAAGSPVRGTGLNPARGFGDVTDADGRAILTWTKVPAGTATTLSIRDTEGRSSRRIDVVTRRGWSGAPQNIALPTARRLTIAIAGIDQKALKETSVRVRSTNAPAAPSATRIGQTSNFELALPDRGPQLVAITYPGGVVYRTAPASSDDTRHLAVDVRRGASLVVKIVEDGKEDRSRSFRVRLFSPHAVPGWGAQIAHVARSDEGDWTIDNLPSGRFVVKIDRGYLPAFVGEIQIRAGGTTTERLTVPRPVTISGEVRGASSTPLGGCNVLLHLPGGGTSSDRFGPLATSHMDGRFEVTLYPIDGAFLEFQRDGHASHFVPIDKSLASRAHRVSLEREGPIVVRGGDAMAVRLPGTDISFEPYVEPTTVSPPPGGTPLLRLPIGEIELLLWDREEGLITRAVTVTPGRTTVLDLRKR